MYSKKNVPQKKTTQELLKAIEYAVTTKKYVFSEHGYLRSRQRRNVSDLEILKILSGNFKWHEAIKDKYYEGNYDWNYHIRGQNTDSEFIRIVVSFIEEGLIVITVINLSEVRNDNN